MAGEGAPLWPAGGGWGWAGNAAGGAQAAPSSRLLLDGSLTFLLARFAPSAEALGGCVPALAELERYREGGLAAARTAVAPMLAAAAAASAANAASEAQSTVSLAHAHTHISRTTRATSVPHGIRTLDLLLASRDLRPLNHHQR